MTAEIICLNYIEWQERAERPGLQSVTSTRFPEEKLGDASMALKKDLMSILTTIPLTSVLEVGCGIGRFTPSLTGLAAKVTAIDLSPNMLFRAKENTENLISPPTLINASSDSLPFPSSIFDCAIEVTVFQHLVNDFIWSRSIAEVVRVVKPGGYILLCDELGLYNHQISPFTHLRTKRDHYLEMRTKHNCRVVSAKPHLFIRDPYILSLWQTPNV